MIKIPKHNIIMKQRNYWIVPDGECEVRTWTSGQKEWYLNDKRHREDGPAIEWFDGDKHWYYHGTKVECSSQEEFLRILKLKAFM